MRWEGEIMRHPHRKSIFIRYLWILPFIIIGVSFLFFRPYVADLTVEGLLEFTPSDPVLASVVLLLLFALKSMTVVFPLMVLYLAAGHLFPLWWSLPLNLCGIVVCVTIPYLIGRYAQADALANVMQKYPKVETPSLTLPLHNLSYLRFPLWCWLYCRPFFIVGAICHKNYPIHARICSNFSSASVCPNLYKDSRRSLSRSKRLTSKG